MRTAIAIIVGVLAATGLAGCAENATDGEITEMCKHLNKLTGEFDMTPAELRASKTEAEFANRLNHLKSQQEEALRAVDADFNAKAEGLKKDDEKTKLKADSDAAKAAKTADFQKQIDALAGEKASALKQAEQKAKDDAAAAQQAVDKCVAENKGVGIEKKIAQCRILTMSTDDYWKCK